MKKHIISAVLAFGILVSPALAQAQSSGLTSSQVSAVMSLLESFGVDQSTINNVEVALSGTSTGNSCYNFSTNLSIGMSGSAITALQTALQNDGESLAVTGTFGDQTASAVTGFQQKYASDILTPNGLQYGTGYVGVSTRAKLNALCNGKQPISTNSSPTITTASLPNGTVGMTYFAAINGNSGNSTYSANSGYLWSISGLPSGLVNAMSAGMVGACEYGCSSTQISGTPTTAGTYTVTVTLTSGGQTVSEQFNLFIGMTQTTSSPIISGISPTSGSIGTQITVYGTNFTSTGNEIIANGMNWANVVTNNSTSLTFNVPSAVGPNCNPGTACPTYVMMVTPGTYPLTMVNANGTSNAFNFTVTSGTENQPLIITTTSIQSGTEGASYSTTLNGTGGSGSYNWSISGIPSGLTVVVDNCQANPSACASPMQARIVGTLPSSSIGTYPVTVQLQSGTQTVSQQFNLTISQ